MSKILEKTLKDAQKENTLTIGTKQVLNSMKDSKLIVLSQSVKKEMFAKIESDAKKEKIPLVNFQGTSVALGRLCGLQFRISTISFTSITDANIKSILKDTETEEKNE
ncbi:MULTISPECIES: ribosomal L7Ae/L30e/S12e/Gadd45 family protein [Nitrosarchaeum]|jgi:large subunit ribosomal protein L30e|uniref:Ribosomal protein L7Ae/L30e/S12e/Gadd45 n=1 Tax=Nitrosarchaeum koreense MY1 TaxID=1001994 RepID=F9CUN9_9ARCH|nr:MULTISPECIES: ribosomal L7Ae/L30e/S12e/Gadd45 family protein [Nitrosarchaeum]EGP93085.1 Ribosomal protein L7Ae/L30e/S12e/Gadd45 [Nitrosarchaeum koreense MY1]QLH10411.1 50S ribosomal protein L7ae [Nitrosarchaeum sp. AC2]HXW02784.1 ribosomal L7Ae/L30e/S12e/Gadd45 family protein [Nitrosarchaeum sp.]